jgi:hypothetical protein
MALEMVDVMVVKMGGVMAEQMVYWLEKYLVVQKV